MALEYGAGSMVGHLPVRGLLPLAACCDSDSGRPDTSTYLCLLQRWATLGQAQWVLGTHASFRAWGVGSGAGVL